MRLPVDLIGEFVGLRAPSSGERNGEKWESSGRAKFLFRWSDGEPDLVDFPVSSFDRNSSFDVTKLSIGDRVRIIAIANLAERDAGPEIGRAHV